MALGDGNKESAKELLSTFRSLAALEASALFLIATLGSTGRLHYWSVEWLWASSVTAALSLMAMVYLFFLVIPKLHREETDIVNQPDVLLVSMGSLGGLLIALPGYAINMTLSVLWAP